MLDIYMLCSLILHRRTRCQVFILAAVQLCSNTHHSCAPRGKLQCQRCLRRSHIQYLFKSLMNRTSSSTRLKAGSNASARLLSAPVCPSGKTFSSLRGIWISANHLPAVAVAVVRPSTASPSVACSRLGITDVPGDKHYDGDQGHQLCCFCNYQSQIESPYLCGKSVQSSEASCYR
jgi:hypothetical protein